MCGIVGYIGNQEGIRIALEGLKRLEYRGYDSSGMAAFDAQKEEIISLKRVGRVAELEKALKGKEKGNPVIFHTRWATHGNPSEVNAHPHSDCKKRIWLVHNGIIENYKFLKEKLIREGHRFISETDTEVLSHLIEKYFEGNLEKAVVKALRLVKGTYAIAVISTDDPQKIVAARYSAPLLIGLGEKEFLVASDPSAVLGRTRRVIYLDDEEVAVLTPSSFTITNFDEVVQQKVIEEIEWSLEESQKGGFPHFMLKEIYEQPESLSDTLRGRLIINEGRAKLGGLEAVKERLFQAKRIYIIACGTAYLAGLTGKYMIEEMVGLPVEVDLGSEFRYRQPVLEKESAAFFISQSGETADTLASLRMVKEKGILSLGIVNVVGSSIARETDAGVYNHAGPEIAVASTKAFTSQLAVLALLTLFLGEEKGLAKEKRQEISKELSKVPQLVKKILEKKASEVKRIAQKYKDFNNFLYLGRKYNFPIAQEGALKLKEISYVHAEGYGAGEMKHGPLAMINEDFPTIAIVPLDSVYEKMVSNIMEIKARKGKVIAIASEGDKKIKEIVDDVIYIPRTLEMLNPILTIIPLQLFSYYVAVMRGCDVDKPRNLAKSVTVE